MSAVTCVKIKNFSVIMIPFKKIKVVEMFFFPFWTNIFVCMGTVLVCMVFQGGQIHHQNLFIYMHSEVIDGRWSKCFYSCRDDRTLPLHCKFLETTIFLAVSTYKHTSYCCWIFLSLFNFVYLFNKTTCWTYSFKNLINYKVAPVLN
jgi:tryptophan-rich sensory protein